MSRRLPPLSALRAFEAAGRHLSMTRAADELCVTHGAVSHQVKALEGHLGTDLFRRMNRRITLTEAGERLLASLRGAFDLMEAGVGQAIRRQAKGTLAVSCLATFTMRWLIPRLHRFKARHPEIEVRLSASDGPVDFDREGIDVAIRIGMPPWPGDLEATEILSEAIGPVLSPPLVADAGIRRPADLARLTLLHTETRPEAWREWLDAMAIADIDADAGQRFEHFYFLLQAAASGLGAAIGSRPLVEDDLAAGHLVAPFGFLPTARSYVLLHPKASHDLAEAAAFRDWVVAEAGA